MSRKAIGELGLDKLVHERARLMILTYLASSSEPETGFTELRDELGFTAGNLSTQLRVLEEAGYVALHKEFRGARPYTGVRLEPAGKKALEEYLKELEIIVASLKSTR